jgi:hypothetical protein
MGGKVRSFRGIKTRSQIDNAGIAHETDAKLKRNMRNTKKSFSIRTEALKRFIGVQAWKP